MFTARLCQLVMLGIVAGCTTQPAKVQGTNNNVSAAGPDVQCHVVQHAGSMIGQTVCTTKAQRDTQQANVNDLQNALESQGGGCRPNCSSPVQ
jgi:hypothetical protein